MKDTLPVCRPETCRENEQRITEVATVVEQNQDELRKLTKAVLTGNGQQSLLARVGILEKSVASMGRLLWGILIAVITELIHSIMKGVQL